MERRRCAAGRVHNDLRIRTADRRDRWDRIRRPDLARASLPAHSFLASLAAMGREQVTLAEI